MGHVRSDDVSYRSADEQVYTTLLFIAYSLLFSKRESLVTTLSLLVLSEMISVPPCTVLQWPQSWYTIGYFQDATMYCSKSEHYHTVQFVRSYVQLH